MLLTVVTVCWNAEETIRNAIESILEQSFTEFEYLVIDGFSTDNTYKIVCEYDDAFRDRGIVYRHISEKDNGIYDAMNKAVKLASGEWISYINADDSLYSSTVLSDVFADTHSHADVVYGNVLRIGKDNQFIDKASPIETITMAMPFCHQSSFTRTKYVKFDTIHIVADYKLFLGLYLEGKKFEQIDQTIAKYSIEGFSNQNKYKTYLDVVKVKEEYGLTKAKSLTQKCKNVYHRIVLDDQALGHQFLKGINSWLTEKRKK